MKSAVIVFPGSNCDRDVAVALEQVSGRAPLMVWHNDTEVPPVDFIVLPGGFSFGDYLRAGAMAAHSPIMRSVKERAAGGTLVLGICNGFQVLCEAGLLPGVLMHNSGLRFVCRDVHIRVDNDRTAFTGRYGKGDVIRVPVAHNEGNYFSDSETVDRLESEGRVVFRYCSPDGKVDDASNPNGSRAAIAGIVNEQGNVLGMMPHPERVSEPRLGGTDGRPLFESVMAVLS
ncbi:MAG: phosphoribosylformylglycinamidine synthase subunit PurQ [Rhodospirillales bacterium]|nr:phosphoribosylformylglycinamidine synthase subunit PurQ [Rhodospirillales bacterium]